MLKESEKLIKADVKIERIGNGFIVESQDAENAGGYPNSKKYYEESIRNIVESLIFGDTTMSDLNKECELGNYDKTIFTLKIDFSAGTDET